MKFENLRRLKSIVNGSKIVEQFKPYPHDELYLVSDFGRVFGLRRGRLVGSRKPDGYVVFWVVGEQKMRFVHRAVLETFMGPPPDDSRGVMWVNHKNGLKDDNRLVNLEWTTISENIQHSYDVLGRKAPSGPNHWAYGKFGVIFSEEVRRKMSEKKREYWQNAAFEEFGMKLSELFSGRPRGYDPHEVSRAWPAEKEKWKWFFVERHDADAPIPDGDIPKY